MATEFECGQEDQEPQWYTLKVQVNREERVQRELMRRVELYGLGKHIEQILVPIERVAEIKNGRKREVKRKLFPGYLLVKMVLNDETWFLMRDAPGVGDFTGSGGRPLPMTKADVDKFLKSTDEGGETQAKLEIPYEVSMRVKVIDGTYKDLEGEVSAIDELAGSVTVNIPIFGKETHIKFEYWQIEKV